jgi:thioredoxin 1
MASPNVQTFSEANFGSEVLSSPKPVLVDFWAEWCGPCKMLGPILDELADEYAGKVKIGKVNVDENNGLAVNYRITGIPALLLFKNGEVVGQMVGLRNKRDLKASLDSVAS